MQPSQEENLYPIEMGLYDDDDTNPDLLLPAQYFGNLVNGKSYTAEHRLLAAILMDAVNCFLGKSDHEIARAWQWFCSPRQNHFTSFRNICHLLDIQPDALWHSLVQARKEKRKVKRIDIIA